MAESAAHRRRLRSWLADEAAPEEHQWLVGRPPNAFELTVVAGAFAASAAAIVVVAAGTVVDDRTSFLVVIVCNVLTLAFAGLVWLRARPWSPFGRLLLLLAGAVALTALVGASSPAVYAIGILAEWTVAIAATWLMVSFPSGRLDRGGTAVVGLAVAVFVAIEVPELLVASTVPGVAAVGRCTVNCPQNALLVSPHPGLAHDLSVAEGIARVVWALATVGYLTFRFGRASRPRRRIVVPVYATSLVFAAAFGVGALLGDALDRPLREGAAAHVAFVVARIAFPLGFVGAILLAQAHAGSALATMSRELGSGPSVGVVEGLVRRVLDDPGARIAFWLPRTGRFADRHGRTVELDPAAEFRSWRSFDRGGDRVLAVQHDPALAEDPELVEAVGAATLMALENRRLQQDLLDSIAALRASQRRLLMAAAVERRKIERDLHDSTQQKLVALRIQLELAREQATARSGLRGRLASLGNDLDAALDELRAVAHGIYPQLLSAEGLPAALREAARRSGVPVELELRDVGRLPVELETAVYYCCLEALQNAAKHAGEDASISLRLWREGRTLRFSVVDDGAGFVLSRRRAGIGLTSMSDRIAAVGGAVTIHTVPGGGTAVEGRIAVETGGSGESHDASI